MSNLPLREVPLGIDRELRLFLCDLRNRELARSQSPVPPSMVTNLRSTALPGANLVEFTRSDADQYILVIGLTGDLTLAQVTIDLGEANQYVDYVGGAAVARFYWVKPRKGGSLEGPTAGYVKGTTGALNVGVVLPTPVISSAAPTKSDELPGAIISGVPGASRGYRPR